MEEKCETKLKGSDMGSGSGGLKDRWQQTALKLREMQTYIHTSTYYILYLFSKFTE